jgi:Ca2+-binding EF-hand superfamily protein
MESSISKSSKLLSPVLGKSTTLFVTVYRLFPKVTDLKALHQYYDKDGDGNVCYSEFVGALS